MWSQSPGPRQAPPTIVLVPEKSEIQVLYLGGLGRSGTTLLERLLSQIDGMQALGETVHGWVRSLHNDDKCGCGDPFSKCEFWQQVGKDAFGGWPQVDTERVETLRHQVDRLRRVPALLARSSRGLDEYLFYYVHLYRAVQAVSGAHWLVDSSKHASLAHCLRHSAEIELRVVHVVRDPRAVAYSWSKFVERPDVTSTDSDAYMSRYSPPRTAVMWMAENTAIETLRTRGVPVHRVRYEDFVEDPQQTVSSILAFVGLPDSGTLSIQDHAVNLRRTHTLSGNPMRFDTGEIVISPDIEWQDRLPTADRRTVGAMTWPLAHRYSYPVLTDRARPR